MLEKGIHFTVKALKSKKKKNQLQWNGMGKEIRNHLVSLPIKYKTLTYIKQKQHVKQLKRDYSSHNL